MRPTRIWPIKLIEEEIKETLRNMKVRAIYINQSRVLPPASLPSKAAAAAAA